MPFESRALLKFERGFVDSGALKDLRPACPAWGTVRKVSVAFARTPLVGELLSSPLLRSLDVVWHADVTLLATAPGPIRASHVTFSNTATWSDLPRALEKLPALKHLELLNLGSLPVVTGPDPRVADVVGWVLSTVFPALEGFTVHEQYGRWVATILSGAPVLVTIRIVEIPFQSGWPRLKDLLALLLPLRPKLIVRSVKLESSERTFLEKALPPFAPAGFEIL